MPLKAKSIIWFALPEKLKLIRLNKSAVINPLPCCGSMR